MKKYLIAFLIIIFSTQVAFATYGVQTKTSHCIVSTLPDTACSPGAVLTTDVKTICTVGYTKTVRNVTDTLKKKVFKEYDIAWKNRGNYEVDHIISLELGGSNDITNLYPESYLIINGARVKDKFENYLHKQVCDNKLSIEEAQKEISSDWFTNYNLAFNKKVSGPPLVAIPKTSTTTSTPSTIFDTLPMVKKSKSGLCHAKGTRYYDSTDNYTPYTSTEACITSGGKLPKI